MQSQASGIEQAMVGIGNRIMEIHRHPLGYPFEPGGALARTIRPHTLSGRQWIRQSRPTAFPSDLGHILM